MCLTPHDSRTRSIATLAGTVAGLFCSVLICAHSHFHSARSDALPLRKVCYVLLWHIFSRAGDEGSRATSQCDVCHRRERAEGGAGSGRRDAERARTRTRAEGTYRRHPASATLNTMTMQPQTPPTEHPKQHRHPTDTRASQTRARLIGAFTDLMCTYPIDDITVKEVVAKAKLTRQTFYRHFSSKEDILDAKLDALYTECFAYIESHAPATYEAFLAAYFTFWHERHATLQTILEHNPHWLFTETAHAYTHRLYPLVRPFFPFSLGQFFPDFLFGGLVLAEATWLERGCQESPEAMAKELSEYWA
ncbi:hypothetical protein B9G54_07670 [Alloscardovia macacae]|nr:hypothetical protein B9G54_07670 [Alloscardovia macacae]